MTVPKVEPVEVAERLEQVRAYLRDYPHSVVAVSYSGDAPPLVRLAELVTSAELLQNTVSDPVLARFVQRLKRARPDLTLQELLQLPVPVSAGDQEVYTARLGKWLFEQRTLEGIIAQAAELGGGVRIEAR